MIRSGISRLTRIAPGAGLAALALVFAGSATAQNPPRKVPGGPYVVPGASLSSVEPGRDIQWTVQVNNPSPNAGVFAFVDAPQGNHLPPAAGGQLECEAGGQGGASEQRGWQTFLEYHDDDGDGVCEAGVVVTGPSGPLSATVACDTRTQTLEVRDINIPGNSFATINFITLVSPRATPGAQVCNWGHIYAPAPGPPPTARTDTYPYNGGGFTAGCSCLTISTASGFDVKADKTARITSPTGRLIPGDPTSTIQYTITITNSGGTDINDAQMLDVVGGPTIAEGLGLEWLSIDDCPAPLTCTLNPANTRLQVQGITLRAADPDESITILATAKVLCDAASDIDDGRVCNQANLSIPGQPGSFSTDDPDSPLLADPTCVDVVWSNLTTSQKFVDDFVDGNGNSQLDPGERVNFRIRARNVGTLAARNVVVTDDLGTFACLDPGTITALDGGVVAGSVVTWDVGDLAPLGGARDVRFSAALTTDQLCCNQASLQSQERLDCGQAPILTDDDASSEDPDAVAPDPSCASPGPQPDLQIAKTVENVNDIDGDGEYDAGERVRWTITIENTGVGAATAVRFEDVISVCMRSFAGPGGVTLSTTDGTDAGDASASIPYSPPLNPGRVIVSDVGGANGILPGETVTITFEANIGGVLGCCNQGEVTYAESASTFLTDDPGTPGLADDATCLQQPPCVATGRLEKRLEIIQDSDLDGRAEVGEGVQYTMTFTNVGCGDLTNIRITDASQACLAIETGAGTITIEPASAGTDNSAAGTLDVTIPGPIAPAESVVIRFGGTSLAEGPGCCNQATWTATELPAGGLSDDDVTDLTAEKPTCSDWLAQDGGGGGGNPDLVVTKSVVEGGCQDLGGIIHYQIRVDNVGDGDLATFTLTDVVPAGLTNVIADAPLTYDAGTNTVSVVGGPMAARAGETYKFQASLPCSGSGTISNSVRVTYTDSTGAPQERIAAVDVSYGSPLLTTSTKTRVANPGGDGVLGTGDTVDYTITVTNSGTCDARSVVVTDVFEAIWDLTGAAIGQGGTLSPADTVRWDDVTTPALARIAPGASVVLTVTVPVAGGVAADTSDDNTADVVATGHDLTACGLPQPGAAPSSPAVCINCVVATNQQDLLVEIPPGPTRADVLPQLPTDVFEASTPISTGCPNGMNDLDVVADVVQTDVAASLATGVTIPAAQVVGPVVFIEVSERCTTVEGGTEPPIIVRKALNGDLIVIEMP